MYASNFPTSVPMVAFAGTSIGSAKILGVGGPHSVSASRPSGVDGQLQTKSANPSRSRAMQVPPLKHGFGSHGSGQASFPSSRPHFSEHPKPVKPSGHKQLVPVAALEVHEPSPHALSMMGHTKNSSIGRGGFWSHRTSPDDVDTQADPGSHAPLSLTGHTSKTRSGGLFIRWAVTSSTERPR